MRVELNEQEKKEENRVLSRLLHEVNKKRRRIHTLKLGELQELLDIEEGSLHRILKSLEDQGYLRRSENTALGLRLCPTPTQQKVLDKIRELTGLAGGRPPTLVEIGKPLGMRARTTVHHHVCQLETRGWVQRDPLERRSIRAIDDPPVAYVPINIRGATGAGRRLAEPQNEGGLVLSSDVLSAYHGGAVFALRVEGSSMTGFGVLDGDLIVVYPRKGANGRIQAFDGEMVVAQLEDDSGPELTVRYYLRHGDEYWLVPRGSDSRPIRFNSKEARLIGIVIALVRALNQPLTLAHLSDAEMASLVDG